MSYQLTLNIREDSPQGQNIEAIAEAEQVTREEAALRLLAMTKPVVRTQPALPSVRQAAVKAVTGSPKGSDWILQDFNDQKRDEIERENAYYARFSAIRK